MDSMSMLLVAFALAVPQAGGDAVVVCTESFREALAPWVQYRQNQGHQVVLVSNAGSADEVRQRIRQEASRGSFRFVVLVGDSAPTSFEPHGERGRCVPVHWAKAEVNTAWGSEPHIGTDNWYADLDDDQVPDLAIGRMTVDTPQELSRLVNRILNYEQSRNYGPWRRQMNFVAGTGGFGLLADFALESAARYFLSQEIPASYQVNMTYGSWRSPFCPDPRLFQATTLQSLSEGCQFWVYLGHGQPFGLDRVTVPDGEYPILSVSDVARLDGAARPPIALLLACYTGAFDAIEDCLAEQMLRAEGGPIAVLAGSRVTMPYANAVFATELLHYCIKAPCPTLGEAVLQAKQAMVGPPHQAGQSRAVLDALAAALSPSTVKLADERKEHVLLFNLLGDPMLRLSPPKPVELAVSNVAETGPALEVSGTCPIDGRATVELVVPRDRLTFTPPTRSSYPHDSADLAGFQEVYHRANDQRLASCPVVVKGGRFATRLEVPDGVSGACYVRVFVEGSGDCAVGAVAVKLPNELTTARSAPTMNRAGEVGRRPTEGKSPR
jgi:hypothetical protein